jgi:aminoacylase
MVPGKPIFLFKWPGSDPSLKAILLNCHADVVPVDASQWSVDPFSATKLPNGDILARGAQDMKSVGIGYLEAIRALKVEQGIAALKRPVLVSFVPDEEVGGHTGMELWVQSDHFKCLNIGLVLDEGLPNPGNAYTVFYGERAPWWMEITTTGKAGHGSQFIEPNATLQLVLFSFCFCYMSPKDEKK